MSTLRALKPSMLCEGGEQISVAHDLSAVQKHQGQAPWERVCKTFCSLAWEFERRSTALTLLFFQNPMSFLKASISNTVWNRDTTMVRPCRNEGSGAIAA